MKTLKISRVAASPDGSAAEASQSISTVSIGTAQLANNLWTRFRGLQFYPALGREEGLLLVPCGSIHMFFMRFPIDAIYLDRENRVLAIQAELKPWRIGAPVKRAHKVLEISAGRAREVNLAVGDVLLFEEI